MTDPDLTQAALAAMARGRHTMRTEPVRIRRAEGFAWEHAVQVALPASYDNHQPYPVLWVLDGSAYFHSAVELVNSLSVEAWVPEMVVVGIGAPDEAALPEVGTRRMHEFTPSADPWHSGPGGDAMRALAQTVGLEVEGGGAAAMLSFLVDTLRPELAAAYRLADDHTLFGHSAGGTLVGYTLLTRPAAFTRYICGSPYLYSGNEALFELEQQQASELQDLPVSVFFGAGEQELTDPRSTASSLVGSMLRLSETLQLRGYPSLRVTARLFPGEGHASVAWPLLSAGLRAVFLPRGTAG